MKTTDGGKCPECKIGNLMVYAGGIAVLCDRVKLVEDGPNGGSIADDSPCRNALMSG